MNAEKTLRSEVEKTLSQAEPDGRKPPKELVEDVVKLLTAKGEPSYAAKREEVQAALKRFLAVKAAAKVRKTGGAAGAAQR